jgi:transcriptional regulator GlxA family with amidase domain
LLETTNQNVSEIAAMAGFENAVYFSNLFKSKFGLAPTLYRKKLQDE